ncbi:hypothetical protein [Epilithonimonas arachidiradicis]|uniref:Uncharacterized protein n=1 Tax=Epilithonimonas arachidiradicis TaxID=1617282 RepID=A0A420CLD7_9FLAO|nr:hypothetical protein [Epilithonimonas arachidiradicis]RKE79096.1 hypothetical protein BXY58_3358 [Epilithonimonas arachidiradicis]GGG60207.1 hypothetical protein GCM10007332_22340 [Epilithonimonas arachidiradicis]
MNILLIQILFFCLIPIGIFILVKAIQILIKTFNGKILLEIPYLHKGGQFCVTKAGYFSVWQKGQMFKQTPIDKFKLHIYEKSTNEEIKLNSSFLRPQTNNFSTGRMEFYRFYASVGNYEIEFREGSNVSKLESLIGAMLPLQPADLSKYFIEIRQSQPQIITLLAIPMVLIGLFGAVGGLVMGLIADQIFI